MCLACVLLVVNLCSSMCSIIFASKNPKIIIEFLFFVAGCSMDSQTVQRMAALEAENELMDLEYNEDKDSQKEENDISVNEPAQSTHTQSPKRHTHTP